MKIVLAGCGKVGRTIAEQLCAEDHDVTVIDNNPQRVRNLANEMDVMGIQGSAVSRETLLDAGCDKADLFIALTGNDEINLLSALLAKRYGADKTIVRIREPEYDDDLRNMARDMGISMIINPEQETAREIFRSLTLPQNVSSELFCSGKAEIFKIRISSESMLVEMPIKDITGKLHCDVLVCFVERNDQAYIPGADFVLKAKDVLTITGNAGQIRNFFSKIQLKPKKIRRVMAVGAGRVAHYLSNLAESSKLDLTLIEMNDKVCERFAVNHPEVTMIQGNGSEERLLLEEGLMEMDAFISLTGLDEQNVILSLYAQQKANIKTVTKVTRVEFNDLFSTFDLDTVVNPRHKCMDAIIGYVRAQQGGMNSCVETVHKMARDQVEALEFLINDPQVPVDIPLREIEFKPGVLVALIVRKNKTIVPMGNDCLKTGDRIILITSNKGYTSVLDAIKEKSWL